MVSWLRYYALITAAAVVTAVAAAAVPSDDELQSIGWAKHLDPETNNYFYYTFDHSEVTWDNPFESGAAEKARATGAGAGSCTTNSNDSKLLETFQELVMAPRNLALGQDGGCSAPTYDEDLSDPDNHGRKLMDWLINTEGGFFSDKLTLRRDGETSFGMYATGTIEEGDIMLRIPRWMVVTAKDKPLIKDRVLFLWEDDGEWYPGTIIRENANGTYQIAHDDGDREDYKTTDKFRPFNLNCKTVQTLSEELKKGSESRFGPYIDYLNSQPKGQLPSGWSKAGKDLLLELLSHFPNGVETLPPAWPLGHTDDYREDCGIDATMFDPLDEHAYLLLMQRGWDDKMIPVFDMMGHRNGWWTNTKIIGSVHEEGEPIIVQAARDIHPGEQIYTTYNWCEDCSNRKLHYGTPELLRDYGFVERFPQRWVFHDQGVIFDLDQRYDENGQLNPEILLSWVEGYKHDPKTREHKLHKYKLTEERLTFFTQQLKRLESLGETVFKQQDPNIPDHEWQTLSEFHEAYTTAIRLAIEKSGLLGLAEKKECADGICAAILNNRYDFYLDEEIEEEWDSKRPKTCDDYGNFNVSFWEFTEIVESQYQSIKYLTNDQMDPPDTCFMLDRTWQQCTSYRPHYHEMAVHYTARYLDEVKRVLFVGGGDSMLLHDILEYPTVEKVIGLEIDQLVTRLAFKHFGVQPHFDDERVEWWYGDAAKSMLMLPSDHYGSFDMVLVDLSETVTSNSVTKELDIMDALSLLIKPNGILLKNEYAYFPKHKSIFKDTLHIHYYNTSIVCSQSLMLGSNGVDFLRSDFKDHGVDHIYRRLDSPNIRFELNRDYQRNATNPRNFCLAGKGSSKEEPAEQQQSTGITLIVEAEEATVSKIESSKALKETVEGTLKKLGLSVLSTVVSEGSSPAIATVLREGYVVARSNPGYKYCGFDIHLWGSFEKHDDIKRALITAVGSSVQGPSSSSYRIVSGGMFGVSTWREDQKNRGPKLDDCDADASDSNSKGPSTAQPSPKTVQIALQESLSLVRDGKDLVTLVICGKPGAPCKSVDTLKKVKSVKTVIPIYNECFAEGGRTMDKAIARVTNCEVKAWKFLQSNVVEKNVNVRAIFVDESAELDFVVVLQAIFKSQLNKRRFLTENMTVVAPLLGDDESNIWRKNFVDSFRKFIFPNDPSFKSEIYFNQTSDGASVEFSVASSGDILFFEHLVQFVEAVEKKAKVTGQVDNVRGGDFDYQDPFIPDQVFVDADFDQVNNLKQWESQTPLGYQVLSQLVIEKGKPGERILSSSKLKSALKGVLARTLDDGPMVAVKEFTEVGEGVVLVAHFSKGNVVILWDGRDHVDVNLYLHDEDERFAGTFEKAFGHELKIVKLALKDEQPRGTGRVVNFAGDLEDGEKPRWV